MSNNIKVEQYLFFIYYLIIGITKRLKGYIKYEIKEARRISTQEWWNRKKIKQRKLVSRLGRIKQSKNYYNKNLK